MKTSIRLMALVAIVALAAMPSFAADDVTMEGQFVWEREDGSHDGGLKAIFTPTGDGTWDVAFHFDWEDGPHVYTGSCSGDMDGELTGDVVSDGEREMNFKFMGAFEDGTYTGTHGFVDKDGEIKHAGTLTLSKG